MLDINGLMKNVNNHTLITEIVKMPLEGTSPM